MNVVTSTRIQLRLAISIIPQNTLTTDQREFALSAATRAAELLDTQRCSNFINRLLQRAADVESRLGGGYLSTDGVYVGIDKPDRTGVRLAICAILGEADFFSSFHKRLS